MAIASPAGRRWTVAALLALTGVTGLLDAVSYLRLGHVFAANMTGNVVFLGFSLAPHSGLDPLGSAVAIGAFSVGALMAGRLGGHLDERPHVWLATAFTAEALALALIAALTAAGVLPYTGRGALFVVGALSLTFGAQNGTVRRLGVADLLTTVLTLTLTGLSADSALAGGPGARPHRRLGSVVCMFAGAAVGALLLRVTVSGVIAIACPR